MSLYDSTIGYMSSHLFHLYTDGNGFWMKPRNPASYITIEDDKKFLESYYPTFLYMDNKLAYFLIYPYEKPRQRVTVEHHGMLMPKMLAYSPVIVAPKRVLYYMRIEDLNVHILAPTENTRATLHVWQSGIQETPPMMYRGGVFTLTRDGMTRIKSALSQPRTKGT